MGLLVSYLFMLCHVISYIYIYISRKCFKRENCAISLNKNMAHLPSELVSHSQKVCSLYKRALRCIRDWNHKIHDYRIQAILMRERFDKNKDIKDMHYATYLLQEGEKELFSHQHFQPMTYPNSATGGAYGREGETPDCVLDYWHPLEKARYPKYFARREQMKNEYVKWYFETYPEEKKTIKDH